MKTNHYLFQLLVLLITTSSFAQLSFTSRPSTLQLYARQSNDSATVSIAGKVSTAGYSKAIFTMRRNGILQDSTVASLTYSAGKASFNRNYSIHAEKSSYRFVMYLYAASATEVMRADSVCSGDVFLVSGQSNGVALLNTFVADTAYTWVRSFGSNNSVASECLADTAWGLANSGTGVHHLGIGVWAYRLGKIIADSTGIPVCFINGAKFGSRIIDHLPTANHANVNSTYGRLMYRANKAKVSSAVKGIFWYQGESDGDTAYAQYANRFSLLYNSWKADYPSLSKITVMQTRPGCMSGTNFIYHQQLREVVRKLPLTYPDVSTMTTVAIPDFDGCHFLYSGYYQLAKQLYNHLKDDFYSIAPSPGNNAPRILQARYTNNSNTELSLIFDQPVLWPSTFNGYNIKDYLYLNNGILISSGMAIGDTLKLQLASSSNADKISYLPNQYYTGTITNYQGPWLVNSNSIGVPTFYEFPINNNLTITGSFCSINSVLLTTNRTGQAYQWYLNGAIISGATAAQYSTLADGIYTLEMKDVNNKTLLSNPISIVNGKRIPVITSTNGSFAICTGSSLTMVCDASATNFQWYKSGVAISNANAASYTASANGSYTVWIQDASGCSATSAAVTITSAASLSASFTIANQYDYCKDTVVTLTANNSNGYTYQWQKSSLDIPGAINRVLTTITKGTYRVVITNSTGCTKASGTTTIPIVNPIAIINAAALTVCPGDSVALTANSGTGYTYKWFKNYALVSGSTQQTYYATSPTTYGVRVTNSMGCSTNSPPKVISPKQVCAIARESSNNNTVQLLIYPHPFINSITLRLPELDSEPKAEFDFEISTATLSKVLYLNNIHFSNGEATINTTSLAPGIYFYRLISSTKLYSGKMIKE